MRSRPFNHKTTAKSQEIKGPNKIQEDEGMELTSCGKHSNGSQLVPATKSHRAKAMKHASISREKMQTVAKKEPY